MLLNQFTENSEEESAESNVIMWVTSYFIVKAS